jgi:hypothetical protein
MLMFNMLLKLVLETYDKEDSQSWMVSEDSQSWMVSEEEHMHG